MLILRQARASVPSSKRLSPVEEQALRTFLIAIKDFGYNSYEDGFGGVAPGYLVHFDYSVLGRYDPAREDIPGKVPVPPLPEDLQNLWREHQKYWTEESELAPGAESAAAEGGSDTAFEIPSTRTQVEPWWPAVSLVLVSMACVYYLYQELCAAFL